VVARAAEAGVGRLVTIGVRLGAQAETVRRIATAHGYNFSPALKGMDIVWTRETVARLFEIGPNAYTPGTKMPEQVITSAEDRKALVEWLEKVTR
jgi:cytochrome c